MHPEPSLIENLSLKKASSHLPYDLSGLKLSCPEGDGVANVLTLVHSSLCVAMLLVEGGSIKTPSSILIYSDSPDFYISKFKHQLQRSLLSQPRTSRWQGHPENFFEFCCLEALMFWVTWTKATRNMTNRCPGPSGTVPWGNQGTLSTIFDLNHI